MARFIASNNTGDFGEPKWHVAKTVESRGSKGTLFGTYEAPACGARLSSAFGSTTRDEINPDFDDVCKRCAKNTKEN